MVLVTQISAAQTYLNINFANGTNKFSLLTDVATITFDGSGGILFKKTDASVTTETMNQLKSLTLDASSGGGAPLPVELVAFTAEQAGQSIQLKWVTAAEMDNYGFQVERRIEQDNMPDDRWITAGFVLGSGNSNTPKDYSFSDKSAASGRICYRLKQIDRSGRYEYSKEVEVMVSVTLGGFMLVQNYPNPFNPSTLIRYQVPASGRTSLAVYDMLGRTVAVLVNEVKEAGIYSAAFDGSNVSGGIYLARLQHGEQMKLMKMILLK